MSLPALQRLMGHAVSAPRRSIFSSPRRMSSPSMRAVERVARPGKPCPALRALPDGRLSRGPADVRSAARSACARVAQILPRWLEYLWMRREHSPAPLRGRVQERRNRLSHLCFIALPGALIPIGEEAGARGPAVLHQIDDARLPPQESFEKTIQRRCITSKPLRRNDPQRLSDHVFGKI